ncbi:hypothetical protein ABLB69_00585 [Xenorhabdus khoisanae]|uniref:hypothetical protein n=1 Tax=Xenorhabdus khoisanae TaxID=880157 RepID=UPI0032B862AF
MQAAVLSTQPIPHNTSTCVHSGAQISIKGKADIFCFVELSRARDCMLSGISKKINELADWRVKHSDRCPLCRASL